MGLREEQIAQAKAMKTPDGKRMFSDEQIDAHIKQLDLQKTFSPTVMGQQQEPETQKLRSALQGTTFKFADEAEAYLRSVGGENYDEALKDVRLKIKNYETSRPV